LDQFLEARPSVSREFAIAELDQSQAAASKNLFNSSSADKSISRGESPQSFLCRHV
jgi:hypothetical protein